MNCVRGVAATVTLCLAVGTARATDPPATEADAFSKAGQRLAVRLFARVAAAAGPEANVVVATGDAFTAAATVAAGEAGPAEASVRKALELNLDRDALKAALTKLAAHRKADVNAPERVFLGLAVEDGGPGGVRVSNVVPGSAAAAAGIQPGDRLVSVRGDDLAAEGTPIRNVSDFVNALDEAGPVVRVRCRPARGEGYVTRRIRLAATGSEREGRAGLPLSTGSVLWYAAEDPPPQSFLEFARDGRGVQPRPVAFAGGQLKVGVQEWFDRWAPPHVAAVEGPGTLGPGLRTVFTDTMKFQPAWAASVRRGPTEEVPFTFGRRRGRIPFQTLSGLCLVRRSAEFQSVEVPCTGGLAVVFIRPATPDGLVAAADRLAGSGLADLLGAGEPQVLTLAIPAFEVFGRNDLRVHLAAVGLATAFPEPVAPAPAPNANRPPDEAARPSPRPDRPATGPAPSAVLQQVHMRVTDDGAEGRPDLTPAPGGDTLRIDLDHPFLFVVYDRRTCEVLIVGRLVTPRVS